MWVELFGREKVSTELMSEKEELVHKLEAHISELRHEYDIASSQWSRSPSGASTVPHNFSREVCFFMLGVCAD